MKITFIRSLLAGAVLSIAATLAVSADAQTPANAPALDAGHQAILGNPKGCMG